MRKTTEIWELPDQASALGELLTASRPTAGDVVVGVLDLQIKALREFRLLRAPTEPLVFGDAEACGSVLAAHCSHLSRMLRETAQEIAPERHWHGPHGGMSGLFITAVCRNGEPVAESSDLRWLCGWKYSNHFTGAFLGDVFVVTPTGWLEAYTGVTGSEPRLQHRRLSAVSA